MKSLIRLLGAVHRTPPANPMAALEDLLDLLAAAGEADLILLPRMALCPPSGAALLSQRALQDACMDALEGLVLHARALPGTLVLTTPLFDGGSVREETVLIHAGEYTVCPAGDRPAVLRVEDCTVCILPGTAMDAVLQADTLCALGCDLALIPAYEPVHAGDASRRTQALCAASDAVGCAVLYVCGGVGDTSSPEVYSGRIVLAEEGRVTAQREASLEEITLLVDVQADMLHTGHPGTRPAPALLTLEGVRKSGIARAVSPTPYLPDGEDERRAYLGDIFDLQVRSLAARLDNTGLTRMLLGVSGGLDSTLALLVCAAACDRLGLPRGNVLGVTMPGFGTTDRTYFNALQLMEQLGASVRDIPISGAVSAHFEDIGHNPALRDVTYENAQARERSQILFDLSNSLGGLVVGTGDLSEAALGFSTFGGDHLAGYNVNITLGKTTIRALVRHIAEADLLSGVEETLTDILDTPVSPELLPPDESGAATQKSEEILGPYVLHDFFLHCWLRYHFAPDQILEWACAAFQGTFDPLFIRDKLELFLRRFFSAQFKRSCAPDAAAIVEPNLCGYPIPSDMSAAAFLAALPPLREPPKA